MTTTVQLAKGGACDTIATGALRMKRDVVPMRLIFIVSFIDESSEGYWREDGEAAWDADIAEFYEARDALKDRIVEGQPLWNRVRLGLIWVEPASPFLDPIKPDSRSYPTEVLPVGGGGPRRLARSPSWSEMRSAIASFVGLSTNRLWRFKIDNSQSMTRETLEPGLSEFIAGLSEPRDAAITTHLREHWIQWLTEGMQAFLARYANR